MKKQFLFLLVAISMHIAARAVTRFWVGRGATDNWNNTLNWSATSGGATSASVPGAGDNAFFDGAGTGAFRLSCTLDINVTVARLISQAGFAGGIINQGAFTVTVNSTSLDWGAGTFNGGSGLITVGTTATSITISGGNFNIGTGGFRATGGGLFDITGGTMATVTGSFYTDKIFTLNGGTFNGGSAELKFRDKNFNFDAGTFNSTTTNLYISSAQLNIRNVPGWNHNNCTIYFDSTTSTSLNFGTGPNVSVDFYKMIINKTGPTSGTDNVTFADTDSINVLTDLDILDGQLNNALAAVKLNGNFTAQAAFSNSNVDFIFTGSGNQTINLIGAAVSSMNGRFFMRKPNASLLTFLSPVTLDAGNANTLIMQKGIIVTTATNILTVADNTRCQNLPVSPPATYYIEDNNCFIEGPMVKTGNDYFVFPLGNRTTINGQKATPISMSGTTNPETDLGGVNTFFANYFPVDPTTAGFNRSLHDPTINSIQACEYWVLNRTAGTANAFVWVSYKNASHSCGPDISLSPSGLRVTRWDGAKWADHGHGTFRVPDNYHISSNGTVNSFSPFTTASNVYVLPVKLNYFTGIAEGCQAGLKWESSDETNASKYEIQQSADGIHFSTVSSINAKGVASMYSVRLDQPVTRAWYRLQMTDVDGKKEYSSTVPVKLDCTKNAEILIVYPSVLKPGAVLSLKYSISVSKGPAILSVTDISGKKVKEQIVNINPGINFFELETAGLSNGLYTVQITGNNWKSESKKIVLQ